MASISSLIYSHKMRSPGQTSALQAMFGMPKVDKAARYRRDSNQIAFQNAWQDYWSQVKNEELRRKMQKEQATLGLSQVAVLKENLDQQIAIQGAIGDRNRLKEMGTVQAAFGAAGVSGGSASAAQRDLSRQQMLQAQLSEAVDAEKKLRLGQQEQNLQQQLKFATDDSYKQTIYRRATSSLVISGGN